MKHKHRSSGFSFVEVVAALVILSMSLVVLMESQTRSMDLVARSRAVDDAVTLASARMAEISQLATEKGVSALKPEESGDFDHEKYPGFQWRYRVVSVPAPDFAKLFATATGPGEDGEESPQNTNAALFAGPLQAVAKIWGDAIKEIHLEITWKDGNRDRSYELVTHVLSPDAVNQMQGLMSAIGGSR